MRVLMGIACFGLAAGALLIPACHADEPVGYAVSGPTVSPDGSKIAFSSDHGGGPPQVYRINTDGTQLMRLTNPPGSYSDPAWSPDGQLIVCEKRVSGASHLFRMRSDGSEAGDMGGARYETWAPSWLPDGSALVATTSRGGDPDLILIDSAGKPGRYIAASRDSEDEADCSPSGNNAICTVLEATESLDGDTMTTHIFSRSLTDIASPRVQLTCGSFQDQTAEYSPDGTCFVFVSNRADPAALSMWLAQSDGSNVRQVPLQGAECLDPTWMPSGATIVFVRVSGGEAHVCTVNSDGTGLTQVTHQAAVPVFDPGEGTYSEAQTVSITCTTPGAIIRYTTDGSEPTGNSVAYSAPITVDHSLTLKAKAWKTDYFPSYVAEAVYTIE